MLLKYLRSGIEVRLQEGYLAAMFKKLALVLLFFTIFKTGTAQTSEETLAWLKSQLPYLTDRETIHHFAFTETHLEYHGSTRKGEITDNRIITFRWKDIHQLDIGYAKVSTNLYISGKGMLMRGEGLPLNTAAESMPLAYWATELNPKEFLKKIRRMAELKGALLEPERD